MSIAALLKGVETRLRSAAVLNDVPHESVGKVCGVQPDGSPPAGAGQWYYAIWFAGARNADMNSLSMDWFYSATVTITARMAYAPKDRRGARMTLDQELLDRAISVASTLHQDDLHRIEANKLIAGTEEYVGIHGGSETVNGFLEPLRLQGISQVKEAPPGWMGTAPGKNEMYFVDVRFADARRIAPLGS